MLAYLGSSVPQWMDGVSLLDPAQVPRDRRIFGVSEILRREGPAGLRPFGLPGGHLLRVGGVDDVNHVERASAVCLSKFKSWKIDNSQNFLIVENE